MTGGIGWHTPQPDIDTSWMEEAECRGMNPDLFFPRRGEHDAIIAAKTTCQSCPVRSECLDYAVITGQHFGIWGGAGERERRRRRMQLAPTLTGPCPTCGGQFRRANRLHTYCSAACQKAAKNGRRRDVRAS